ncbi:MAG TPA: sugar-binding protein [bacterium]|nr:sugar-binding protein [bacterium]
MVKRIQKTFSTFLLCGLSVLSCRNSERMPYFILVPKALTNPYWLQVQDGMKEAAERLKVKAEMIGPVQAADVSAQVQIIESLLSRRVDGIAISPNDPDGVTSIIDQAVRTGIPVITFDSDAPRSQRLCYIGTDNYAAGRAAGRQLIKIAGRHGRHAILTGSLGALNLNERIKGFRDELKEQAAEWQEVNLLFCDDATDRALDQMEELTRATPSLNAWFVCGGWAAVAGAETFRNALNRRSDIVVISFDTVREELLLVKAGLVQALIGQRPHAMGVRSVEMLTNIVVNKKMPDQEIYDTGIDIVTPENVDRFLSQAK